MISYSLKSLLKKLLQKRAEFDMPMQRYTSFKIGGNADCVANIRSEDELKEVLDLCKGSNTPFLIIGNGSNLLVSDSGIDGVVIRIANNFSSVTVRDMTLVAKSGVLLSKLSSTALSHSLCGLEFAGGIPGTLGGGVYMNAGAYGGELSDVVVKTKYMTDDGDIHSVFGKQHEFGYRKSFFSGKDFIILESEIKLKEGDKELIKEKMQKNSSARRSKQPLSYPSAGSVFKRPEGMYVGPMVESCGLKGFSIGGAQVSELHAGFIINKGGATAKDVIMLIEHIKKQVFGRFGVLLECEIKMVGRF